MKVASRLKMPYNLEKCPVCLEIGGAVPFFETELGGVPVLICAKVSCRCLFVPSFVDLRALVKPVEVVDAPAVPVVKDPAFPVDGSFACTVCGKWCKSALGLGSHMRSHAGG